ncbi:MAG: nucleotidyl transferase AbiEii/AbiGii toxin family protein [Chloroflexota bacterium]
MDNAEIQSILQMIGKRVPPASRLILVGGSALSLLGSPRPTIDIDFIGDDVHPEPLHQIILRIAEELDIDAEPVPPDKFVPLPLGNEDRTIRMGQYGNLEIFIADPYSIALSKVDRGADTDYDDLVFLVQHNHVDMSEFERMVQEALPHARQFDFHPDIRKHLQELKKRLGTR